MSLSRASLSSSVEVSEHLRELIQEVENAQIEEKNLADNVRGERLVSKEVRQKIRKYLFDGTNSH